jgi:murein DD-endopeptidase MepM/ murein hydrolase activator NlpD
VAAPSSDRFGPRGNRFHTGLDFPAPYGRNVRAARAGTVIAAGYDPGGYGNIVRIAHGSGTTTFYAHLSRVTVRRGERVAAGERVATVGSTGFSSGPHLHFEVWLRGAMLDPLTGLR